MNTCIKCGRTIPDGELFCAECSLNPYDFTDTPQRAAPQTPPGRLQAPVRQPKPHVVSEPPAAPRRRKPVGTVVLAVIAAASLLCTGYLLLTQSSRRVALQLREEALTRQEAEFSALQTERDTLASELDAANEELAAKNDLIATLRENINTAESAASQSQYDMTAQQNELAQLTQALEDKQTELTAQQEKYDALLAESAAAQEAQKFMQTYVVLVENDGTGLYHRYGCANFAGKTFWAYSRKLAENSGYSPCPNCIH